MATLELDPVLRSKIRSLTDFLKDPIVEVVRINAESGTPYNVRLGKEIYTWVNCHPDDGNNLQENSGVLIKGRLAYHIFIPLNQFQPKYQRQIVAQLRANNVL